MPRLIDEGYLYIAQPPLYRVDYGSTTEWALTDDDRDRILKRLDGQKRNWKVNIQRFKGLGEMMADTLRETTLDPDHRRLLRVTVADDDDDDSYVDTDTVISNLMGRDASTRFDFIMANAQQVDELDV